MPTATVLFVYKYIVACVKGICKCNCIYYEFLTYDGLLSHVKLNIELYGVIFGACVYKQIHRKNWNFQPE